MEEIHVKVVEFSDRKCYQMQYVDPLTDRKKTRSTKVERTGRKRERTEAERVAAKWEAELREGRYKAPSLVTWAEFRLRYEDEVLSSLADNTGRKVSGIFNVFEDIVNPTRLRDLTPGRLCYYQQRLREKGRSESTIEGHLAHLISALNWAVKMGLLASTPSVKKPKRAKKATKGGKMKGRPITLEEFERMLGKIEKTLCHPIRPQARREKPANPRRILGEKAILDRERRQQELAEAATPSWRHYLQGLWLSGLRLEESMELTWDDHSRLCIDLSGEHPMLSIPAELEKGHRDRLLPLAPEFAEFLLATPQADRTGYVFNPMSRRKYAPRLKAHRVGEVVAAFGEAAGVKVHHDQKSGSVKYASAHDLRRSFGERWANRIMPIDLMILMRHESMDTTLRFYVGRNAQNTAKTLWDAHKSAGLSNTLGNRAAELESAQKKVPTQNLGASGLMQ
ncbi:MAG: site-specific integrase [Planctomycetota bacterium]|nr:site-specific integrase [Planctomycetota bacterium]